MKASLELHSRKRDDGLQLIQIKVNDVKKRYRISSEIYVKKSQFQNKYLKWVYAHPLASDLNEELEAKLNLIKDHYKKHSIVNPKVAIVGRDFYKFGYEFIEKYNNKDQKGTYGQYKAKLNKLKTFKEPLNFEEIDVRFIRNYIIHLKKKFDNDTNTIAVDLRKIRAIINQAIKDEVIPYEMNPFKKIKIETKRTGKEKLSNMDLTLLRKLKLTGELIHVRNIFFFCLNCMGMRIGSALRIKSDQINGSVLSYQMNKGGKMKSIELTKEARGIVKLYGKGKYLFPYLEGCTDEFDAVSAKSALINKGLKKLAQRAEIKIHLTTHIARHTLTRMAIESGVDMRSLQGMLNHSTVAVTEQYAGEIADVSGNEALKKIFKS